MKLYGDPLAPTTQMVLLCLAEKGGDAELVPVRLGAGEHRTPEHRARHPFGLTPVLEGAAGLLYEARAILRYLDRTLPGPALTPADPWAFGRMEQFISVEQSYFSSHVMVHFYARVLGIDPGPERLDAAREAAGRALAVADAALAERPYLAGDALSLADLVWSPYLAIARFVGLADLLAPPRLAAWSERLHARPAWHAVMRVAHPPAA